MYSYTQPQYYGPRIVKRVTTVTEYDRKGQVTKQIVTEEEFKTEYTPIYPETNVSWTGGSIIDYPLVEKEPDGPWRQWIMK
jgi:hypothetical protein